VRSRSSGVHLRGGGFFQEFSGGGRLDAALAFAPGLTTLPYMSPRTWKLDVAGMLDELFHVEAAIAEGGGGFGLSCLVERHYVFFFCGTIRMPRAAAAG